MTSTNPRNNDLEKTLWAAADKLRSNMDAAEYILGLENGEQRFNQNVTRLSQSFGPSNPHPEADKIRDELAFYDALHVSETAEAVLGDAVLREIALELTASLRGSVSIDWNIKESVQAAIRVRIKRILRKYQYPPDESQKAVDAVMEQTETLAKRWTG